MDLTIDHTRLLAALSTAHAIADKRAATNATNNVYLTAHPKTGLTVAATDLMLSSTETCDVAVDMNVAMPGALAINARHLLNVVKTMPPGPVRLQALDNHWLQLTAKRSTFKLMGQSGADFPALPELGKGAKMTPIAAAAILSLIAATGFSIATDEARVNLNGLLLESTGKRGTAVSTDGHRLSRLTIDLAGPKFERGIIIPRKGVVELRNLLKESKEENIEIAVDSGHSGHLFVRAGTLMLSIKLNNVVFPPYEQVIPKECRREAVMKRVDLATMLARARCVAPEKTATIKLSFVPKSKLLEMTADNPDFGVVSDAIELDSFEGEAVTAGFNANYLLEALDVISTEKVVLRMQGELDPLRIQPFEGPDYVAVIMPMRV